MKHTFSWMAMAVVSCLLFMSCKKDIKEPQAPSEEFSAADLANIKRLGFGTKNLIKVDEGYIVEGDILLTPEHLKSNPKIERLRIGNEEQYRTWNTVYSLPRTITVRVSTSLPSAYVTAVNTAISRYNALNLLIKFQRVTTGGHIVLVPAPAGSSYLASAGFPTDAGQPWNTIRVNTSALNSWAAVTKASVMAHEIGHCIGFRHSDWYNRAISCGGAYSNEGDAGIGWRHIPGTPTTATWAGASWMLACINNGMNRPFTASDKIALNFLY